MRDRVTDLEGLVATVYAGAYDVDAKAQEQAEWADRGSPEDPALRRAWLFPPPAEDPFFEALLQAKRARDDRLRRLASWVTDYEDRSPTAGSNTRCS